MFSQTKMSQWAKRACCGILICLLSIGLVSCGGKETPKTEETEEISTPEPALTEVAPPAIFQELRQTLDNYQPQVSIVSPKNGDVIEDTRVSIKVDVKDYPLFKNEELGMGPHLHVILDNQPYRAVYNADDPIIFEDLAPGTHTVRMFASRPWHESFKNEGAYAQVTFHLFTETGDNAPDLEKPLLTYSRPKGSYGAEPILLDYYLTNAPIRLFEQESDSEVEVNPASQREWRVRATINGESFIMDSWLPVYLEGFQEGRNWIKLELLDADGNLIENAFNTAARLFTYQPQGKDTLSKLVRGELSAEKARLIVDPDYQLPKEEEVPAEEQPVTEPEEPEEKTEEKEQPKATAEEQEETTSQPEAVTEPETPKTEQTSPEEPVTEPETEKETVSEPEASEDVEETSPEATAEEQEETTSQPEAVTEPETPKTEQTSPEEPVTEPETEKETVSEPEASEGVEETSPEATTEEQEETTSQPEATEPQSEESEESEATEQKKETSSKSTREEEEKTTPDSETESPQVETEKEATKL